MFGKRMNFNGDDLDIYVKEILIFLLAPFFTCLLIWIWFKIGGLL